MFTLTIEKPNLNPYSKRQMNADVECHLCGRGIPNRQTCKVAITKHVPGTPEGTHHFIKIADHTGDCGLGYDPVGWGTFIGSHCAKQLPKEYKVSMKRCMKAWEKTGYQNT